MLGNKINFDDVIVWLDGNYLTWKQAQVPVFNYTLQYGQGVFEGIRAYIWPKLAEQTFLPLNMMHYLLRN